LREILPFLAEALRIAYHPTTAKIFDRFQDLSIYKLQKGRKVIKEYCDQLSPLHQQILELLDIQHYWPK